MFYTHDNSTLEFFAGLLVSLAVAVGVCFYVSPPILAAADFAAGAAIATIIQLRPVPVISLTHPTISEDHEFRKAA